MKIVKKWRQFFERKRNSMPRKITGLNIGLLIAFVMLIFGLIASFAAVKSVTAQAKINKDTKSINIIEIDKPINMDIVAFIKERLKVSLNDGNYGAAVVFNTTEIEFDASIELTKILLQNDKLHKIAFIRQRIESSLFIPVLAFDEIVLEFTETNVVTIGPYNQRKYSDFAISEAISYFRGSNNTQLNEFAPLIEKYFDNQVALYHKNDAGINSYKLEKTSGFSLLSGQSRYLIITPTEAEKLGLASLIVEGTFEDYLVLKKYDLGRKYTYKPSGLFVKDDSTGKKNIIDSHDFENNRAALIDISTDIDEIVADSIERRIDEALKQDISMIILKLDTPGGRIDSTLRMIDKLKEVSKKVVVVAWVDSEAISAGAMLAVSCKYIAMSDNSAIGDCQPIIPTTEGYTVAGEKIQTYLRTHFRQYAAEHGISEALGMAMVTEGLKVIEIKPRSELYTPENYPRFMIEEDFENWIDRDRYVVVRTVVREGELLTLTDDEAREYGFAMADIKTFNDLKSYFDIKTITEFETSTSESFLRFMNMIAPIIIALGMLGLFIEMKTPGFGLFGILGIAIIGGFFAIKLMVGLADYWEVLIFASGIILVVIELYIIPGTGVFGLSGILAILAGIFLAGQPFIIPATNYESEMLVNNFASIIFAIIIALIAFYLVAKYLHRIPIIRNLILETGKNAEELHASAVEIKTDELVGAIGVTTTDLRPVGKAIIGNELNDVQVRGHDYVEKGSKVIVIETSGNRIIVRRYAIAGEEETKINID